jgi:ParB-like chromosome segregation protein Spo0J
MRRRPQEPEREAVYLVSVAIPPERARALDEAAVARLMESMARIGLQTPITLRPVDGEVVLVAGMHRLEAARRLGWSRIDAVYFEGDERDAQMWEIAENLHRAELKALERDAHAAEWIRLAEEKLSQDATVSSKGGRGHEGGVRAAARELGITKDDAHRALKVASLPAEAKQVAREIGLDNNRSALLKAAASANPADELRRIRAEKDAAEAARLDQKRDKPKAGAPPQATSEQPSAGEQPPSPGAFHGALLDLFRAEAAAGHDYGDTPEHLAAVTVEELEAALYDYVSSHSFGSAYSDPAPEAARQRVMALLSAIVPVPTREEMERRKEEERQATLAWRRGMRAKRRA